MCKEECEEVLKTNVSTVMLVFKRSLKQETEKILSCIYKCLKPVFIRQSVISYKNYNGEAVEFIANTSFTEGVLKFTEKVTQGSIYDGNVLLKTLVLAFCKMKLLEHLQKENRISMKNKKFAFDNQGEIMDIEDDSHVLEKRFEMVEHALALMEPADRQIIVWRHHEERSNDEIARLLDISTASATNRIYRCMQRLRALIENSSKEQWM